MSNTSKIIAIVPAAGSGQRMNSTVPKQYLKIDNQAVLDITLSKLLACSRISAICVCLAEDDEDWPALKFANHEKVTTTVGGKTRAQSVMNGLQSMQEICQDSDWALVHDAARPCIASEKIEQLINQLSTHEVGGILALPAVDTLKQSSSKTGTQSTIEKTIDRSLIWQAQTPQMFRFGLLKEALATAIDKRLNISDESSAIEAAGYSPLLVEGSSYNLKITRSEDLPLAEFCLNEPRSEFS